MPGILDSTCLQTCRTRGSRRGILICIRGSGMKLSANGQIESTPRISKDILILRVLFINDCTQSQIFFNALHNTFDLIIVD